MRTPKIVWLFAFLSNPMLLWIALELIDFGPGEMWADITAGFGGTSVHNGMLLAVVVTVAFWTLGAIALCLVHLWKTVRNRVQADC